MTPFYQRPRFILWSLFVVVLGVVILQNMEPTDLRILFWTIFQVPKLVLIVISMALGALIALFGVWDFGRKRGPQNSEIPKL